MISSEVQRTLVKSPPELWAELSDPAALARHLGELGEIRITRAEPEKRVEWEAETASGTVLIKPSGWGTKVTLSVTREIEAPVQETSEIEHAEIDQVEPPTAALEPEPAVEVVEPAEANAEILRDEMAPAAEIVEPDLAQLESEQTSLSEAAGIAEVPEAALELTSPSEPAPQPAPRRGFFARLFARRQPKAPEPAGTPPERAEAEVQVDTAPIHPAEQAMTHEATITGPAPSGSAIESLQARFQAEPTSEPVVEASPELVPVAAQAEQPAEPATEAEELPEEPREDTSRPSRDLAAELKAAEEAAAEEVTGVLTAVLDRLGAAHHRPFSRA
jgi:hypothetical protein